MDRFFFCAVCTFFIVMGWKHISIRQYSAVGNISIRTLVFGFGPGSLVQNGF